MDQLFLAQSKLRRRQYDEAIAICDAILAQHLDKGAWFIKTRALTLKDYLPDDDMEEEGIAEALLDDNAIAKAPRPGTSLRTASSSLNQAFRPLTSTGRPVSGFARPATSSRAGGGAGGVEGALTSARPGTSRPISMAGRYVRLGTQSLLSGDEKFINADRLDVNKYARKPALAKALCDFLIYSEHNAKKAMELCAAATEASEYGDWWWKLKLGQAYYLLGMYRDAEKQYKSALRQQKMVQTHMYLAKVYLKIDQPQTALEIYQLASQEFPVDVSLVLGAARVYDGLGDMDQSVGFYKRVLELDASNVEAIASLASHYFYSDQPEVALRFYRRLIQMGVNNTEIWNNVGLCCFYAAQYDLVLSCFQRALRFADDDTAAEVWYNIGHIAIGIGDLSLAYQALKISVSVNPDAAESFNNLGILELRKNPPNIELARSHFKSAARLGGGFMFEPLYNGGLLAFKLGDCEESFRLAEEALRVYPGHTESRELLEELNKHFTML